MDTETRIKKLEERIEKLENPTTFSNKFIEALIKEGFLKYEKELFFTSFAGLPYIVMFVRAGNSVKVITADPPNLYVPFTVNISSDDIVSPSHGFSDGMQIILMSTGTLPAPLSFSTSYWVMNATADTFQVSVDNITPVNITNSGVGTHYARFFT